MKRADAERAIKDFDGLDWGGSVLKVGWSKAVPLPQKAIYGELARFLSFPSPRLLKKASSSPYRFC